MLHINPCIRHLGIVSTHSFFMRMYILNVLERSDFEPHSNKNRVSYLWTRIACSWSLSKLRQDTAIHSCSCFGGQSLRPSSPSQTSVRSWSINLKVCSQTSKTNGIRSFRDGPLPTGAVQMNVCLGPQEMPLKEKKKNGFFTFPIQNI